MASFQNMTRLLIILAILLPLSAHAGELRIVKCTQGLYAVQEYKGFDVECPTGLDSCYFVKAWETLTDAPDCYPLDDARWLRDGELAWRNRPPAPQVIEPVQVVE